MLTTGQLYQWVKMMSNERKKWYSRRRTRIAGIFGCAILLQLGTAGLFDSDCLHGQSTLVASGANPIGSNAGVPNSLSREFLRTEMILSQPVGQIELTIEEFAQRLRAGGIAVMVDYENIGINEEENLTLVSSPTLARSLDNAMAAYEATYTILRDGTLKIIREDERQDPENLVHAIYDISNLVDDWEGAEELFDSVQDGVWSDSWTNTGTGEGTLSVVYGPGKTFFFSVGQHYQVQIELRGFLNDLHRLQGRAPRTRSNSRSAGPTKGNPSARVKLPGEANVQYGSYRSYRFQHAGGLFNIPSDTRPEGATEQ